LASILTCMPVYSQEDIVSVAGSAIKDRERPAAVFFENIVKQREEAMIENHNIVPSLLSF
jgi:hypothetical protein